MTKHLTAAQRAQQSNRTTDGKYTTKAHSEADTSLGRVGPTLAEQHVQQQREALAKNVEVERQAWQAKQDVLDLLDVHDLQDELRALGVRRVEVSHAPEYDYDAPGSMYVASEPEFLNDYQPTADEEQAVLERIADSPLSFNTVAGADTNYAYGDEVAVLDTTKEPGGFSRHQLEDQVEAFLDTGDEYRIPGGLDPAKVTSNSNSKLSNIESIHAKRHLDPNHRMELILQQAEQWDRATRKSTSRPNKYGNVPSRYNHLGGISDS
jgi:hypothetical protein